MALPASRLCHVQSTLKAGLENAPAKTSGVMSFPCSNSFTCCPLATQRNTSCSGHIHSVSSASSDIVPPVCYPGLHPWKAGPWASSQESCLESVLPSWCPNHPQLPATYSFFFFLTKWHIYFYGQLFESQRCYIIFVTSSPSLLYFYHPMGITLCFLP